MPESDAETRTGPQLEIAFPMATHSHTPGQGFSYTYHGLKGLGDLGLIGTEMRDAGLVTDFRVVTLGEAGEPEKAKATLIVLGELGQEWAELRRQIAMTYPEFDGRISSQADWMTYTDSGSALTNEA